jgi:hypothetical protein
MPQESLLEYSRRIAQDERTILNPLLESSSAFRAFYTSEREQLRTCIFLIWNGSLDPSNRLMDGELARANWIDENNVVIIFRNNPLQPCDASIIAHEIAHVVIKEKGFPLVKLDPFVRGNRECELQVYNLNCMLHDPLVIRMLMSYGFNLVDEYENEARMCLDVLPQIREQNGASKIVQILGFVQSHLQNMILFADQNEASVSITLQRRVQENLPNIVREGNSIIEFIESQSGYDTPEKVRMIYNEIIQNRLGMDLFMTCG